MEIQLLHHRWAEAQVLAERPSDAEVMTGIPFLASLSLKRSCGLPLLEEGGERASKKGSFPGKGNGKEQAHHQLANGYERDYHPRIVDPIVNLAAKDWPD